MGDRYAAAGREIVCPHCGHNGFEEGRAQLNTAGMTFLKLDWLNKSAVILTCVNCGRIEWFMRPPQKM